MMMDGVEIFTLSSLFNSDFWQQIILAVVVVFVNVFLYPLLKKFLKFVNEKLNLKINEKDIEDAGKIIQEKVKEEIDKDKK